MPRGILFFKVNKINFDDSDKGRNKIHDNLMPYIQIKE